MTGVPLVPHGVTTYPRIELDRVPYTGEKPHKTATNHPGDNNLMINVILVNKKIQGTSPRKLQTGYLRLTPVKKGDSGD